MADLTAVRDALLAHEWEPGRRWSVHATHGYSASCAICQGDVLRMLEVAEPLLRERVARDVEAIPPFDVTEHPICVKRRAATFVARTGEPWTPELDDDLDDYIEEQRLKHPEFAEAYDRLEGEA